MSDRPMIDAELIAEHAQAFTRLMRYKGCEVVPVGMVENFVRREIKSQIPEILEVLKNDD